MTVAIVALAFLAAPLATAADDDGWTWLLKNEEDLGHWRDGGKKWLVEDGVLTWQKGCGYIWTKESYDDFVLDLEVKVSKGCNSGIFIRSDPRNAVQGGIEVQVLDSHGKRPNKHTFGAIYDALAPSKEATKPAGEWNHVTITCDDNVIQVVVNGEQIIDMDLDKWTEPRKNPDGSKNKFKKPLKDFAREGHIGFQDHGKPVWYRNVRIKELKDDQ
ncbi:MAG: 3-keto-disaccharide hydrolase [Planctomycetota bacterium]